MFTRLGHFAVRRRGLALTLTTIVLVVAALLGPGVIDRLAGSGFDDPNADSVAARAELDRLFDTGFPDLVFYVDTNDGAAGTGAVDLPSNRDAGLAFTEEIAAIEGTDDVMSYWTTGDPALRSRDELKALVLLRLPGDENDPEREALSIRLVEDYRRVERGPLTIEIAGRDAVFEHIGAIAEDDLTTAELIAVPLTLLLLVVVFRSVVAALIPALVGVSTLLGALLVLYLITEYTDVSIFAINLVTTLGLGLAIDYSLLVVSRFREERAAGYEVDSAVRRTVRSAGRTVAFSGLTVAVSLSALLIFPIYFLRSFAYAGIGVVVFAMLMSLVAVPAALSLLGDRLESLTVRPRPAKRHAISIWRERADLVVDHPWRYLVGGTVVLVALAAPFAFVHWGEADHRTLPASDPIRRTTEKIINQFDSAEGSAIPVVALGNADPASVTAHAIALSQLDGVTRVDTATGSFVDGAAVSPADETQRDRFLREADDAAWFNVVPGVNPIGNAGERLVVDLRALEHPFDDTLVGGGAGSFVDTKNAILDNLPRAALLLFGATYVLLFLTFGSLLVPLKAIVLNILSLGATFGMLVVAFQEGALGGLIGVSAAGTTDLSTVVLIFGIAFGLSMDYEVFLLARIKEEYDATGHTQDSIVEGIDRTGPIITAAALLLTVTFLATATSSLAFVKMFGIGLAVAVITDAFLVRITVVPALMTLAGKWNWWAPGPLRRLHDRWGIPDTDGDDVIDLRDRDPELVDLTRPSPARVDVDLRDPAERRPFADFGRRRSG